MTDLKSSFPSDSDVLAVFRQELACATAVPAIAAGPALWPRFAGYYHGLGRLPRRVRRTLQRQWRRSLGGLALLLALGQAPALAATINVDGGNCTLVDAITAANTNGFAGGCTAGSGADTLVLSPGSIHTLTAVNNSPYGYGPSGLPVIASAITIQGNGSTIKRDGSAPPFRILLVERFNGNLSLQDTIVSGGLAASGGAFQSGSRSGGGLHNFGILTLTGCVISGNSASVRGGGINNYGTLTLTDSTVSGNSAGRGGGVHSNSGSSTLSGTVILTDSIVSGNSAGSGGGLYNDGTLTLTNSTVSGNSASDGGGFYNTNYGTLTLTRSTVSGNSATHPSGCCLYNGGGGINNNGTLTLTDSTVSGNQTNVSGGGVFNNGGLNLRRSTVSANVAKLGGGLYNRAGAGLTLVQTLISGNIASQGAFEVVYNGRSGVNNFNLFGHSGSAGVRGFTPGVTDIVPTEPLAAILDPVLRNNGGQTNTQALVRGSPAVDVVPAANCATTVDQRGVPRPQDGDENTVAECDIGAVEGVPPLPLPPLPPLPPPPPPPPPPVTPTIGVRPVSTCQARTCGVRLTCPDTSTSCTSDIRLTVRVSALKLGSSPGASAKARRRVTFAAAVVNVPPGGTDIFKLRITPNGRKIVKKKNVKRLNGRLEVRNSSGALVSNTPITIRLTKKPR